MCNIDHPNVVRYETSFQGNYSIMKIAVGILSLWSTVIKAVYLVINPN